MGAFQVVVTCTPASKLPDELQSLKTTLEIPAGFPPLMESANVKFGKFEEFFVHAFLVKLWNVTLNCELCYAITK